MKNNPIAVVVISLVLGLGAISLIVNAVSSSEQQSHHIEMSSDHHGGDNMTSHPHAMFMVDPANAPTVGLTVEEDEISGWNIKIDTTKFTFTPENVNGANIVGEGHAHLYVDGKKVARLYGPNFHYNENFDGVKTFKVTLNANDHSDYAVGDEAIYDEQQITHQH